MKLKKYKKKKISSYITISIVVIVLSLILALIIINDFAKRANIILAPMGESITRKVIAMIINNACDELIISDKLYLVNKNEKDEIELITYNSFEANKLINEVTLNLEKKLNDVENGLINYYGEDDDMEGVIAEIPFGVIYGNSLLNNIGPMIKLKLNILGDVLSNIETEVKPYGINNAYVEIRIKLEVTARVILPFVDEKISISQVVPISMNIVQGTVPEGYIYPYK